MFYLLRDWPGLVDGIDHLVPRGARSMVRRAVGSSVDDLGFEEPWLVVDLQVNEAGLAKLPTVSVQYCDPARPATYLIGPDNHRRWEIMVLPGEDRREQEQAVLQRGALRIDRIGLEVRRGDGQADRKSVV